VRKKTLRWAQERDVVIEDLDDECTIMEWNSLGQRKNKGEKISNSLESVKCQKKKN